MSPHPTFSTNFDGVDGRRRKQLHVPHARGIILLVFLVANISNMSPGLGRKHTTWRCSTHGRKFACTPTLPIF